MMTVKLIQSYYLYSVQMIADMEASNCMMVHFNFELSVTFLLNSGSTSSLSSCTLISPSLVRLCNVQKVRASTQNTKIK